MNRMPIEDYLLFQERILFWSDFNVTYRQEKYKVFITNLRLLLFREKGMVFKKEEVITENWPQITGLEFNDVGGFSRKGVLKFSCSKGEIELEGPKNGTLGLFKAIQRQTLDPYNLNNNSSNDSF
ncbi:MAG: hypothetical protein NWE89_13700 [Candidatus Bathyarchaeota archaeon]|nr:hypothetical protein [Candidatus Bathyarchaeota archaeon]